MSERDSSRPLLRGVTVTPEITERLYDLYEMLRERFQVERGILSSERGSNAPTVAPEPLPPDRKSDDLDFPVPSRDLVREMIAVPAEEWSVLTGRPEEEVLPEVVQELRVNLLATLADFALTAIDQGHSGEVALSRSGRFDDGLTRQLMRNLPIDPYNSPQVLRSLHAELLEPARRHSLQAIWGELIETGGDLSLRLAQPEQAQERAQAPAG
jgi:hypothetical protein